ncbi:squalene/phytoene synthase family protein [Faunimonas sp. B44]|uniref:squalene/phytoene synthase family protein n=1 Tax=Faunimonas sp. B44 TaxID=3461493 RepID=UPI0040440927
MADAATASETAGLVREADRPRYYATLFAPADRRPALHALYALAAELRLVPLRVREPLLGEIRLQWWRDALGEIGTGGGGSAQTPLLEEIARAIGRFGLSVEALQDMATAWRPLLYGDATSGEELAAHLAATEGAVFSAAAQILGAEVGSELIRSAGLAYGLARRIAARPHAGAMRDAGGLEAGAPGDDQGLVGAARRALADANRALALSPAAALPAFLPLVLVEPVLSAAAAGRPGPGDLRLLARMTAAAATGRVGGPLKIGSARP